MGSWVRSPIATHSVDCEASIPAGGAARLLEYLGLGREFAICEDCYDEDAASRAAQPDPMLGDTQDERDSLALQQWEEDRGRGYDTTARSVPLVHSGQLNPQTRGGTHSRRRPAIDDAAAEAFVANFSIAVAEICLRLEEAMTVLNWANAIRHDFPTCECDRCSLAKRIRGEFSRLRKALLRFMPR